MVGRNTESSTRPRIQKAADTILATQEWVYTLWHIQGKLMRGSDSPGLEDSATWMICQCECVASSACALKKAPTSAPVLIDRCQAPVHNVSALGPPRINGWES